MTTLNLSRDQRRRRTARAALVAASLAAAVGCTGTSLTRLVRPATPHEAYASTLRGAGLHETALGRDWLEASARALTQPLAIELPFHETGYFSPDTPSAVAYRFALRRGRRLEVTASFESLGQGRLFVDLFRVAGPGEPPEHLAAITPDMAEPTVEVERDGDYLLRVQPELLRGGRYTIVERTLASLPFPVAGLTSRRVQSGFGADRDAGARQHEGVDIFAAAGTPVVAVTRGVAQPSTNNLGGNVVWLTEAGRRQTFYYAHLQRSALTGPTTVVPGDVLGYVGNTGNARTTAPHLHFGVYARGAIDPLPFIEADQVAPPAPVVDLEPGTMARVRTREAALTLGQAADALVAATVPRTTLLTVLGVTARRLRVMLPDGVVGYVPRTAVGAAADAVSRRVLPVGAVVRERPLEAAATMLVVQSATPADVLGRFGAYELVRSATVNGWVLPAATGGGSR